MSISSFLCGFVSKASRYPLVVCTWPPLPTHPRLPPRLYLDFLSHLCLQTPSDPCTALSPELHSLFADWQLMLSELPEPQSYRCRLERASTQVQSCKTSVGFSTLCASFQRTLVTTERLVSDPCSVLCPLQHCDLFIGLRFLAGAMWLKIFDMWT